MSIITPAQTPTGELASGHGSSGSRSRNVAVWSPCVTVGVASVLIGATGLRGADYPAHVLRAVLWDRAGPSVWNNLWYAGHPTPTYSVLAAPLVAILGPFVVVTASSIAATHLFARLTVDLAHTSTTAFANHAFALAVLVNVVVGRVPFAMGLATALMAARAWQSRRLPTALAAAALTPLVSPVAGVFLAIAACAVTVAGRGRTREAVAIAAFAATPVGVTALLFGSAGIFPFRAGHLAASTLVMAALALAFRSRVVRAGAVIVTVTSVALFVLPNPLGGNVVRLAQIVGVPITILALPTLRRSQRRAFTVLVVAGVGWSLQPGVVAAVDWWADESVDPAYHAPLIAEVAARNADGRAVGRLEIPFTDNHWESAFVAPEVPYARGWERQVDLVHNDQLYRPELSAAEYRAWLDDNGVRWIALADVELDHAGAIEQRLVDAAHASEATWIRLVWTNDDWRLFEVTDYVPIVDRPAQLVEQGPDWVVVATDRPATVTIRYRFTPHLTIDGSACVAAGRSGWTVAVLPTAGRYRLAVDPLAAWTTDQAGACRAMSGRAGSAEPARGTCPHSMRSMCAAPRASAEGGAVEPQLTFG